ncbi:hypothetical protein PHYPSEUDO_006662 [Phytophthora pseudosyringae]|uniref:Uncharacterized protein n=1 Tax=Phytophthora pseudosyringae TaxID=221518 RepID=A0A8T1WF82_9STRA|nr:hypothetical protein PHYPSEUDO_006662 [Phytophthora pseudosyringae]
MRRTPVRQQTVCEAGVDGVQAESAPSQGKNEEVQQQDNGVAAVKMAVHVQLDDDMAGRDEERATRYLSTVRPAMAAVRYSGHDEKQKKLVSSREADGEVRQSEEGAAAAPTAQRQAEKSTEVHSDDAKSEEGDTATVARLTHAVPTATSDVPVNKAKVATEVTTTEIATAGGNRSAVGKQSRKAAKKRWAKRAADRARAEALSAEAEVQRTEKEAAQQTRRRRQMEESQAAMKIRREERAASGPDQAAPQRVHCPESGDP